MHQALRVYIQVTGRKMAQSISSRAAQLSSEREIEKKNSGARRLLMGCSNGLG